MGSRWEGVAQGGGALHSEEGNIRLQYVQAESVEIRDQSVRFTAKHMDKCMLLIPLFIAGGGGGGGGGGEVATPISKCLDACVCDLKMDPLYRTPSVVKHI